MTTALATRDLPVELVDGELVAGRSLLVEGERFAALQSSPETRRSYMAAFRTFDAFMGGAASVEDLSAGRLAAYRDWLAGERGRLPRTVAHHLSALRGLARALGVPGVGMVRGPNPGRPVPHALSEVQVNQLLGAPDTKTVKGRRDLAILLLMLDAGLRRSEVAQLDMRDLRDVRRAASGRPREVIPGSTGWWVVVRRAKGGKSREVPLTKVALGAAREWVKARPRCEVPQLFVSLRLGGPPRALDGSAIAKMLAAYGQHVGLPAHLRGPHTLRHTFCTRLVDAQQAQLTDIADLAGHASITTTV